MIGHVITDQNYFDYIDSGNRGYLGMFESDEDRKESKRFADIGIPLIPESEWDEIIDVLEKDGASLPQLCKSMGLPCLDQSGTNYCWVNAPTHCCEIVRLTETGQVFSYSPASVGAPVKGFRNIGGWGSQALTYMRENGINLTSDWPANKISRSYYTDDNAAKKKKHLVLEYFVLESWEERVSCMLSGIPTADGYSWWSHEVCGVGIIKKSHDLIIRNSWGMGWGDQGFSTLTGSRKYAGDSVAICAMLAI
jgi:hypothetical protein